ncbi:bacteriophage T4 gp5 trimerisation domain-containing protein, partial [Mesorhizobium retamae]|nr:hypothetical protein [Mesorhizobium sp. IRAMC:0171]
IRVAQNWGGAGWGGQIIPRIGMEAVLSHIDGDFDKPLIVGLVPNARQKVPYKLPENKTKSVFRTNTHKSKDVQKFNELRFDDLENSEEVRLTAQKDFNVIVHNNDSKIVKHNSAESVLNNRLSETFGDSMTSVYGSYMIYTGPSGLNALSFNGIGMMANKVSESAYGLDTQLLNIGEPGDFTIHSDGNHNINVKNSNKVQVGQDYDISVHGNSTMRVQGNISYRATKSHSSSVGEYKIVDIGKKYTIFCGKSRIEMDSAGNISIIGVNIKIIGSEKIDLNP